MSGRHAGSDQHSGEWGRPERTTFGIALAIALLPIPIALLISWALGDPPWRPRHDREATTVAPAVNGHP